MTITIIAVVAIAVLTLVCKDVWVDDMKCKALGPVSEGHWFFKAVCCCRITINACILWGVCMLAVAWSVLIINMYFI